MKIIVFGASGRTGVQIIEQALASGHQVTAFVRTPSKVTLQDKNLTLFLGNVTDPAAVEKAVVGQDAVVSALGPTRPPVPGMMETAAKNITAAMKKAGIRRLVSTTGAGVRDPEDRPKLVDTLIKGLLTLLSREVLEDSEANVRVIRATDLDWTIVRFPMLRDGSHTGKYRVGYIGRDSGSQITRADGADFVVKEVSDGKYIRKAPIVSY
jgi:putative NADH-flavin reductase